MSLDERLFQKGRLQSWRDLAGRLGGQFEESSWDAGRVRIAYGHWPLVLTTYERPGHQFQYDTHVLVPYRAARELRFSLSRRGLLSKVSDWLGLGPAKTGHALFDERYAVSASPEAFAGLFLGREDLVKQVWALQLEALYVLDSDFFHSFPSDHDLVNLVLRGPVSDLGVLEKALGLSAAVVSLLAEQGFALEEPPARVYG